MLERLQYISQGETNDEQLCNILEALDAGCKWIQFRYKSADDKTILQLGDKLKKYCEAYRATFIINDHPQLAKILDADGVHLGLTDMPVTQARNLLGNKIIGGTANTFDDVKRRILEKADYVGVGPLRFTTTKKKLSPVLGFDGYARIINRMEEECPGSGIPVIAIGGVTVDDITPLLECGCHGIALSGAIGTAGSKKEYVTKLKGALYGTTENSW